MIPHKHLAIRSFLACKKLMLKFGQLGGGPYNGQLVYCINIIYLYLYLNYFIITN